MDEWEYTIQRVPDEGVGQFEDALNAFGNDGWELCGTRGESYLIFKRRRLSSQEIFGETWVAYKDTSAIPLESVNTDAFRKGWPKPTIFREHEAIHVLANLVDRLLQMLWCTPGQPHNPGGCDCGEGG